MKRIPINKCVIQKVMFLFLVAFICRFLFLNSAIAQPTNVQMFQSFLSTNLPIKHLRFTMIECQNGDQRQFVGAVDNQDFFLREFTADENPSLLFNTNQRPKRPTFGRHGDEIWQIIGLQVTKTSASDPAINSYQLNAMAFKTILDEVLTLGARNIMPGAFVWKGQSKDGSKIGLEAQIKGNIVVKRADGTKMSKLPGFISLSNGFVSEMRTFGVAHYEYATNWHVPPGIPSKIIIGNSASACERIYVIEELVFGRADDGDRLFDSLAKFISTNIVSVDFITNDTRKVLSPGLSIPPYPAHPTPTGKRTVSVRILILGIGLTSAVFLFICLRQKKPSNDDKII